MYIYDSENLQTAAISSAFLGKNGGLSLQSTINVNTFECGAAQDYGRVWLEAKPPAHSGIIKFERAVLTLEVDALNCGHEAINRDMRTTLKVDQHPHITLELQQIKLPV